MTKTMSAEMRRQSFTSAAATPTKVLRHAGLVASISDSGRIPPIHAQIIPTNACNLACPFCSCEDEDRGLEINIDRMLGLLHQLATLGCEAITITGGGDPLMYPHLDEMTQAAESYGMDLGLVTNGLLLPAVDPAILRRMTWIRVSHGDFRPFSNEYQLRLEGVIDSAPDADWNISYVLGVEPAMDTLAGVFLFADRMKLAHVRVVTDLHIPKDVPIDWAELNLKARGVPLDRAIFQDRSEPECGTLGCWVAYLKPVIHADGFVYPCCGAQYALSSGEKRMPESMRMGRLEDIDVLVARSQIMPFDGRKCVNCYYGEYNRTLAAMLQPVVHKRFV